MSAPIEPADRTALYWPENIEHFDVLVIRNDAAARDYGDKAEPDHHWGLPNDSEPTMDWAGLLRYLDEQGLDLADAIRLTPTPVPARSGLSNRGLPLWRHSCGNVEAFDEGRLAAIGGGCDGCESGSGDAQEWQPLYLTPGGAS